VTTINLRPSRRVLLPVATAALVTMGLAACSSGTTSTSSSPSASPSASRPTGSASASSAGGDAIDVSVLSSEKACNVVPVRVPAGELLFTTSNTGDRVTGFALYEGTTQQKLVGESRNIQPGENGEFRATLTAGEYTAVCRPGETGTGTQVKFTVTKD